MSKHTPGPWEWWTVGIDEEVMLLPKGSEKTCDDAVLTLGWISCGDGTSGKEPSQADQNLIAAAPELLEACGKLVLAASNREHHMGDPISLMDAKYALSQAVEIARSAITKATGNGDS